ncbi:MAG: hypothetical protein KF746_16545 [Chitinophagaceae bacterium]|nr:hypothetical protein [Chitinophagaceae bacterium]
MMKPVLIPGKLPGFFRRRFNDLSLIKNTAFICFVHPQASANDKIKLRAGITLLKYIQLFAIRSGLEIF